MESHLQVGQVDGHRRQIEFQTFASADVAPWENEQAGLANAKAGRRSDRLAQEYALSLLRHDGFQRATIWSVISSRYERRSPVFVNFVRSTLISNCREVVAGPGLVVSIADCLSPRLMP